MPKCSSNYRMYNWTSDSNCQTYKSYSVNEDSGDPTPTYYLFPFVYMKCPVQPTNRDSKWWSKPGGVVEGRSRKVMKTGSTGDEEDIQILNYREGCIIYRYTKIFCDVHFMQINSMLCKLYLQPAVNMHAEHSRGENSTVEKQRVVNADGQLVFSSLCNLRPKAIKWHHPHLEWVFPFQLT